MKRPEVTYGRLDRVLKSLGFSCRLLTDIPPRPIVRTQDIGCYVTIPQFPDSDNVLDYHLAFVKLTLGNYGNADAGIFAAELQRAE